MYFNFEESTQTNQRWPQPPSIIENCKLEHIEVSIASNNYKFIKATFTNPALKMPWLTEYEVTVDDPEFANKLRSEQGARLIQLVRCFYDEATIRKAFSAVKDFESLGSIVVALLTDVIKGGVAEATPLRMKIVSDAKGWAKYDRFSFVEIQDKPCGLKIREYDIQYAQDKLQRRGAVGEELTTSVQ